MKPRFVNQTPKRQKEEGEKEKEQVEDFLVKEVSDPPTDVEELLFGELDTPSKRRRRR